MPPYHVADVEHSRFFNPFEKFNISKLTLILFGKFFHELADFKFNDL